MLADFFESFLRIQELRDGPDGRLLEGFAQEFCQVGYTEITARMHIRAAEHLIQSQQCGWATVKKCITGVRMLLRFLISDASALLVWNALTLHRHRH